MKIIYKSFLSGCYLFEHPNFNDERGNFLKIFSNYFKKKMLKNHEIKQVNISTNKKSYSIRGMHYQNPKPEFKIVKCLEGQIFDVVVDLRSKSKTFMKKDIFKLNSKTPHLLLIPENFAHGYQTLKPNTKVLYMHTSNYYENYSKGFHYQEPLFDINWPHKASCISKKDASYEFIDKNFFKGI